MTGSSIVYLKFGSSFSSIFGINTLMILQIVQYISTYPNTNILQATHEVNARTYTHLRTF